jgi:hypothetical protein
MRRSRMLGACMLAVALSAVFAAGASASLPELGRCVKVTNHTGEYIGIHCIHKSPTHKGEAEFTTGAAKNKFEGFNPSGSVVLQTAKLKISCSAITLNGEYTGAKTSTATLDLISCANDATKHKCQSNPLKEGEIEPSSALKGELGFITGGEKPTVGLDLKPENQPIVVFECGEPGKGETELQATLEGSVIGQIKKLNVMVPEFSLLFKSLGGKQVPEKFEGGATDTLTLKVVKGGLPTTESAVLKATVTLPNEEPLEIKAIV